MDKPAEIPEGAPREGLMRCPACQRLVLGLNQLKHHVRYSHRTTRCPECSIEVGKKRLPRHLKTAHKDVDPKESMKKKDLPLLSHPTTTEDICEWWVPTNDGNYPALHESTPADIVERYKAAAEMPKVMPQQSLRVQVVLGWDDSPRGPPRGKAKKEDDGSAGDSGQDGQKRGGSGTPAGAKGKGQGSLLEQALVCNTPTGRTAISKAAEAEISVPTQKRPRGRPKNQDRPAFASKVSAKKSGSAKRAGKASAKKSPSPTKKAAAKKDTTKEKKDTAEVSGGRNRFLEAGNSPSTRARSKSPTNAPKSPSKTRAAANEKPKTPADGEGAADAADAAGGAATGTKGSPTKKRQASPVRRPAPPGDAEPTPKRSKRIAADKGGSEANNTANGSAAAVGPDGQSGEPGTDGQTSVWNIASQAFNAIKSLTGSADTPEGRKAAEGAAPAGATPTKANANANASS
eukprot:Clim_evm29s142 gene=Clim_evmTU29s142